MAGHAERLLEGLGRRYAAAVRVGTLVPIIAIALLSAAPAHLAATALVVAVAAGWTCVSAWLVVRGARWPVAVDALVLAGVGLSVLWTGTLQDGYPHWIRLIVAFTCIACQWHTPVRVGAAVTLVACGTTIGALAVAGSSWIFLSALVWMLLLVVASRITWDLVGRLARDTERLAAEAERLRRDTEVAEARRAAEREHAAALHDTAATTLLMVGSGQADRGAAWLRPQALRDLELLRSPGEPSPGETDLAAGLRTDLEASGLQVSYAGPGRFPMPSRLGAAVADAAREAVTNVRRHAGTARVTVRLTGDAKRGRLEIVDRGAGFVPGRVPPERRGLRESIHGRLTRAGGTATVISAPGAGTTVRLEWSGDEPPPPQALLANTGPAHTASGWRGLRVTVLVVAANSVFAMAVLDLIQNFGDGLPPLLHLGVWAALLALLATEAVLTARGRSWDRAAWWAVAVVFAASALAYLTLPAGQVETTADWVYRSAAWLGLVVLLGHGPRAVLAFMAAHELFALASLLVLAGPSLAETARFAADSVSVIGYHLCLLVVAVAMRRIAGRAATAIGELSRLRTAEAVAAEAHRQRERRRDQLDTTTFPLLEALASGTLDPEDPAVRRRCALESARMRRLLAEADGTAGHPLLHELRHCADIADRRGVEVEFDARGRLPQVPPSVRSALAEATLTALAGARTQARITIVAAPFTVSVSIVADGPEVPPPALPDSVDVTTLHTGDTIWLEAHWHAQTPALH